MDILTGTFLLFVAFFLFTKPGRAIFLVCLVVLALIVLAGCANVPTAPNMFVCSDPTNVGLCAVERRIYELEQRAAADAFQRDHADRARRTCEFAHGSGSVLCP